MKQNNFTKSVYSLLSTVPKGKVTTYKALAHALNSKAYRAVGSALKKNPNLIKVPCHRAIISDGSIGNYSLGVHKKIYLLKKEGIQIIKGKIDLSKFGHQF
jgi:methylated-DNA-[protein]-cysteine S-methyltransferase